MRNTVRPNRQCLVPGCLLLLLLLFLAVVGINSATAQDSTGPQLLPSVSLPEVPLTLPGVPFSPGSTLSEGAIPAYGDSPPDDYWIVSFRGCPQFAKRKFPCRCMKFLYHPPGGCLRDSNHCEFLASLSPGTPICLMVHGSYLTWVDAKTDARNTFRWVRSAAPHRRLHFVYVSWPSEPSLPPLDISILGRQSARNGFYLANLIRTIPAHHPVSLIGHSHGTRVTLSTLHLLNGGEVQGYQISQGCCSPHRLRAVLAAAAVDHDWLNPGKRYGHALPLIEGVLNLRSRRDRALVFYPLRKPFSRSSLGRKGFTRKDLRAMGPLAARVCEIDVTPLVGNHHFWQFYSKHPGLAQMVMPYIYFPETPTAQAHNR